MARKARRRGARQQSRAPELDAKPYHGSIEMRSGSSPAAPCQAEITAHRSSSSPSPAPGYWVGIPNTKNISEGKNHGCSIWSVVISLAIGNRQSRRVATALGFLFRYALLQVAAGRTCHLCIRILTYRIPSPATKRTPRNLSPSARALRVLGE